MVDDYLRLIINKFKDWRSENSSPYFRHLNNIIQLSAKFTKLNKIVDGLSVDWEGKPEKLVVMIQSLIISYIMYLVRSSALVKLSHNTLS